MRSLLLTLLLFSPALALLPAPESHLLPRHDDPAVAPKGNTLTSHLTRPGKRDVEYYRRLSERRHRFDNVPVPGRGNDNEGYDGPKIREEILGACPHRGEVRCPVLGGTECMFVASDPESCGGCLIPDMFGFSDGVDCTAIPHARKTRCMQGECQIRACDRGYELVRSSHDLAGGFQCVERE